jgi:hypothetical protein
MTCNAIPRAREELQRMSDAMPTTVGCHEFALSLCPVRGNFREVRELVRTRYVALMRKQRLSASFIFRPVILRKMRAMGISILDT